MNDSTETKNKRIAFLVSASLHAALFLTFFFLISWRAPYPPAPEYGVVLNYGLDNQGGGDIQPEVPVGNSQEDQNADPKSDEKNLQENSTNVTEQKEEVKEEKTDATLSDEESTVTVKSEKKKIEDKPKEKVVKIEPKKEVKSNTEEKPIVKKEAVYEGVKGSKKGEANQSQGDDPGKVGDKGNPQGKLDAKALYGKPGGGGGGDGFGLAMSGWAWANTPKTPDLPDNENGRIVFEIECDEDGEIIGIITLERGLSPKAEQLLKDEIRKNSLMRTSNGKAPAKSKGQVVFLLKTK
jgi:periplasmic protein TonB